MRPNVGFTPKVQEGMARLGTWMPFRAAQRELAFFLGVDVAEATVRLLTELAGAAQVQTQAAEVETLLVETTGKPAGARCATDESGWGAHPDGEWRVEGGENAGFGGGE